MDVAENCEKVISDGLGGLGLQGKRENKFTAQKEYWLMKRIAGVLGR